MKDQKNRRGDGARLDGWEMIAVVGWLAWADLPEARERRKMLAPEASVRLRSLRRRFAPRVQPDIFFGNLGRP